MPRRARRLLLPEYGVFHITSRGVGGIAIYVDDIDRERFARLLKQVAHQFGWKCEEWCLMGTHYHLLVETDRDALSWGMHRLNGLYAQGFNRRHGRKGGLFEERFS